MELKLTIFGLILILSVSSFQCAYVPGGSILFGEDALHEESYQAPPVYTYHADETCLLNPFCKVAEERKIVEAEQTYLVTLNSWICHLSAVRQTTWRTIWPDIATRYDELTTKYHVTQICPAYK